MRDTIVLQNLHKRGINLNDMNTLLRYEAPERKPRVLDSAPKRITLVKVKPSELVTLGLGCGGREEAARAPSRPCRPQARMRRGDCKAARA